MGQRDAVMAHTKQVDAISIKLVQWTLFGGRCNADVKAPATAFTVTAVRGDCPEWWISDWCGSWRWFYVQYQHRQAVEAGEISDDAMYLSTTYCHFSATLVASCSWN